MAGGLYPRSRRTSIRVAVWGGPLQRESRWNPDGVRCRSGGVSWGRQDDPRLGSATPVALEQEPQSNVSARSERRVPRRYRPGSATHMAFGTPGPATHVAVGGAFRRTPRVALQDTCRRTPRASQIPADATGVPDPSLGSPQATLGLAPHITPNANGVPDERRNDVVTGARAAAVSPRACHPRGGGRRISADATRGVAGYVQADATGVPDPSGRHGRPRSQPGVAAGDPRLDPTYHAERQRRSR